MRISKRFKLCLMAALVGLAIQSGLVAAKPATFEGKVAANIRESHEPILPRDDPAIKERVAQLIYLRIMGDCRSEYPLNQQLQYRCETIIFNNLCSIQMRWSKEGCRMIGDKLRLPREDGSRGNKDIPRSACATKETGDQLCLISPTTVSSGDLLPISIDIGDLNCAPVDNVGVTVEVSTALGAELSQPYRDPENPGDFDLTWTGGPYDWVGTASLESVSDTVSAQPVFAIGGDVTGDSVSITADVDYTCDGQPDSVDVSSMVEILPETVVTPEELANEREVQIEQSDLDLSPSSSAENNLDSGDIDNGEANGGEVSFVAEQLGEPEDCHIDNSIYDSCPIEEEGVPLK